jgi:hypothetical protein
MSEAQNRISLFSLQRHGTQFSVFEAYVLRKTMELTPEEQLARFLAFERRRLGIRDEEVQP